MVCEFSSIPVVVVSPETETCSPGLKLLAAVNVTIFDAIWYPLIAATTPQPAPEQLAGSGVMLVDSVSGMLLPMEFVLVTVTTSAMVAASHKLTYTWLLSAAAVTNIRKRVCRGLYGPEATHEFTTGTAYCVGANSIADRSDSDGDDGSEVETVGLNVRLAAS